MQQPRILSGDNLARGPHIMHYAQASSSDGEDISGHLDRWGAPALSYIEPVFRPPAESGSLILQGALSEAQIVLGRNLTVHFAHSHQRLLVESVHFLRNVYG